MFPHHVRPKGLEDDLNGLEKLGCLQENMLSLDMLKSQRAWTVMEKNYE